MVKMTEINVRLILSAQYRQKNERIRRRKWEISFIINRHLNADILPRQMPDSMAGPLLSFLIYSQQTTYNKPKGKSQKAKIKGKGY